MRRLKAAVRILLATAAAAGALPAFAQADPRITITTEAVPLSITLSRPGNGKANLPLQTFAAYKFTITNGATNTLNRVFVNATATNVGGTDAVVYDSFIAGTDAGNSCGVGATPNSVTCSLVSLAPGGASTSFFVVFKGPQTGTRIDVNWTGGGFEGNGGGNGCCSQIGVVSTSLVDPTTDTSFRRQAKSFVNPGGGQLFTGDQAIPLGTADGWTTLVTIPGFTSLPWTTATINETSSTDTTPPSPPLACPSYSLSSTCFRSQLTIPGQFASLKITLRLDKAFFNLGRTDPATLTLKYTGDGAPPLGESYPYTLRLCSLDLAQYGQAPRPGLPCLSKPPFVYPNNTQIRDLRGDLEFNIEALDNGRYDQ